MKISLSGLDVEWQRLQVIAQNLANINSTRDEAGNVFKPQRLLSGPDISFSDLLTAKKTKPVGTKVMGIEALANGTRRVFEPEHPHADTSGFVEYTKLDHAAEMTLMIKTSRTYEANLTAISIAQQMYGRALDIGRQ